MRNKGGKGGSLRGFLLLILIVLVGYNSYETWALHAEVAQMQKELHVLRGGKHVIEAEPTADAPSLLQSAKQHTLEAKRLLHNGEYDRARKELAAGVVSFERANTAARTDGDKILGQLREAAQALSLGTDDAKPTPSATPSRTDK